MKRTYSFGLRRQEIHLGSNEYLYGFVNKKGRWVIEPQFNYVGNKFDKFGYCIAKKGDLYGFINPRGKWVLNPVFDSLGKGFGLHQCCSASINKQWGVIDRKGEWSVQPRFEMLGIEFDEQGYCPAAQANKWGFINKAGNWILEPQFDSMRCEATGARISRFNKEDTCIVQIGNQSYRINRKGQIVNKITKVNFEIEVYKVL